MDESELLFNLIYILFGMCIVYPPEEFQELGLTIEHLFARFLGDEVLDFIGYHRKRTSLNLIVHACLPASYFFIHKMKFSVFTGGEALQHGDSELDPDFPMPQEAFAFKTLTWKIAERCSIMAVLVIPLLITHWYHENWKRHPITQNLIKFSNSPSNYMTIASDIGTELRRPDKYKKKLNSISTVIATENWIIKTSLYNVHFAHQSDTVLSVAKTETYNVSQDQNDTLQMVSIVVKPNRPGVADFNIRINAFEFRNLEERINRPIVIPSNIQFHRNVIDRFVEVFKDEVQKNAKYKADRIAERCFACMMTEPNIKINKQCNDTDEEGRPLSTENSCVNCYCRPMWCVDCLARWFAARQSDISQELWLQQKCSCPMCRAKFCIRDVSYLEKSAPISNEDSGLENDTDDTG